MPAYGAAGYVPALVLERTLYVRERSDGLYLAITYLLAKMARHASAPSPPTLLPGRTPPRLARLCAARPPPPLNPNVTATTHMNADPALPGVWHAGRQLHPKPLTLSPSHSPYTQVDELLIAGIMSVGVAAAAFYAISFQGSFFLFWVVYFITLMIGVVLAYFISAASPNMDVANAVLPTYVTALLFFGGFILDFHVMPSYWKWFSYLDFVSRFILLFYLFVLVFAYQRVAVAGALLVGGADDQPVRGQGERLLRAVQQPGGGAAGGAQRQPRRLRRWKHDGGRQRDAHERGPALPGVWRAGRQLQLGHRPAALPAQRLCAPPEALLLSPQRGLERAAAGHLTPGARLQTPGTCTRSLAGRRPSLRGTRQRCESTTTWG